MNPASTNQSTTSQHVRRSLAATALIALTIMCWPRALGGDASFVIVSGRSMEPTYHSGDTLFARAVQHPKPGQVVVYRVDRQHAGAGQLIVHRVRARNADGTMVMQGDNRGTVDDTHPTDSAVVGSPIVNLGPLPVRLMMMLPTIIAVLVSLGVTKLLWPRQVAVASENSNDSSVALVAPTG